jgi:glycerophosphoryl diester phosphodiesterase
VTLSLRILVSGLGPALGTFRAVRGPLRAVRGPLRAVLGPLLVLAALESPAGSGPATLVAAHRGGAALWPENSLLAFRQALALGVDALEFDLHMTADGEVVVLHDPTLDRTSTARGPVRDLRLAALASVRLLTRDGTVTAEHVPTFAEVLDLVAPTSVELLPEIKIDATGQRYDGIEEKVLALLQARGLIARATVQAFQPETIRRLRELEPKARTMFLVARGEMERQRVRPAEAVRRARELGATDLGMNHRLVDAEVLAAARAAGVRLAAWTVNEEADVRRMIDLGVDMVMSDRPDLVKRLRGR